MAAPSARDKRPWYFVEIDDPEVLQKLADGLPNAPMLPEARQAIMVLGDLERAYMPPGITDYWQQDCSAAAENILLAAEAMGLGACWTALYPMEDRVAHARAVIGIPPEAAPLCLIAVGYSAGQHHAKDKFDPTRIFSNHWGVKPANSLMKP
jgi:nitroreductase